MSYRVAIFTLTRDRLLYTKHCFETLREKAGYDFDHYIVDNGSEDGTMDWLLENQNMFANIIWNPYNVGLCAGNNQALEMIRKSGKEYDLIAKFDNDAEVITENIITEMAYLFAEVGKPMLLSPRVIGINKQPIRTHIIKKYKHPIGITNHIGGLFTWCNAGLYLQYTYPDDLPLARGDDSAFAHWVYKQGYHVGYVEDLVVNHFETTEGQSERFPDYFTRKLKEEIEIPDAKT
jgi:glycosyltransferase involved in cell wall biosynthesis